MRSEDVLSLLEDLGAIESGHFELSSGKHSETYVQKFRALERPEISLRLGRELAAALAEDLGIAEVDVVLSPAVGGMLLGFSVASALGARFIFAERVDTEMRLRRGFEIAEGERVVIIDDVLTTGGSVKEIMELANAGELAGIGFLLDRSQGAALGVPMVSLAQLDVPAYEPADCPLCAKGVPVVAPGSRYMASDQRK